MANKHEIGCLILLCFVSPTLAGSCQSLSTLQSSSGTITGPGYPGSYPNNVVYCWRIYAPSGYVVRLQIHLLNMEACPSCSCDSIEVFNGYSESYSRIGKFCSGSWQRTSTGRYLFVKFKSDAARSGTAFTANYYRLAKDVPPVNDGNNNNNYNNDNNDNDGNNKDDDSSDVKTLGASIGGGIGAFITFAFFCCLLMFFCGSG